MTAYRLIRRHFLFYINYDVTRVGRYFANAARGGFRHVFLTCRGTSNEYLFRKKTSLHVSRVCYHTKLCGIASIKYYIAGASFDRNVFIDNNTCQRNVSGVSDGRKVFTFDVCKLRFSGSYFDIDIAFTYYIGSFYISCSS